MSKQIPLSNVDTAWYEMEDPTNLMMITGVMMFKEPIDYELYKTIVDHRILKKFPRFKCKVVSNGLAMTSYYWEDDPNFDIDNHIHHIALPAPGSKAQLERMTSDLMSMPLDFSRPPWHIHVVDNFEGGSAVFYRLHHCIADGIALVQVMLSLMSDTPEESLVLPTVKRKKKKPPTAVQSLLKPVVNAVNMTQKMASTVWQEGVSIWENPFHAVNLGLNVTSLATKSALATGKLLLMPADPVTPFKGKLGVRKVAAWSEPLPLNQVKRIGQVTDSKINDVLLTAMTGALRRYLIGRGVDVTNMNFRAAVPVNLRPLEKGLELGNEFGLVFLSLPVGIEDPFDRLVELKRRMDEIKDSPEALIAFGILALLGLSPTQIADQFIGIMGAKATAVATNVPGPRQPLYMAGKAVDNIMFWVPQSGKLGLGVSIFSYGDKVTLGVATDAGLAPDPENILKGFYEEFEALLELVRQVEEM